MTISDILGHSTVATLAPDYEWDSEIQNGFIGADPDVAPKLNNALSTISSRAMLGMGIAAAEWVVARLSRHVDIKDASSRIDAAWASTIDIRYARLPLPGKSPPDADRRVWGPVRTAMVLVSDCHTSLVKGSSPKMALAALGALMLAEHVAGRDPTFKKWVPDVFKRVHALHPKDGTPFDKQAPVARELFDVDTKGAAPSASDSQAKLLAALDPAGNPYLKPAAELVAEGLANPYPRGG